jgi:glutathione peroxidase-family protein
MAAASGDNVKTAKSAYEFDYIDIDGKEQSMGRYSGHVLIVVNVASK